MRNNAIGINENIIYLGDTKNFPYGNKSKEDIIKIAKNILEENLDIQEI